MKTKLLLLLSVLLTITKGFAQAPQAIPYQAVARDAAGTALTNRTLGVRFKIHDTTATGIVLYSESQTIVTNSVGTFTANIGQGTVLSGSFTNINWGAPKFIQVEMDLAGGTAYVDMGTKQMLSVPYALNSADWIEVDYPANIYGPYDYKTLKASSKYISFATGNSYATSPYSTAMGGSTASGYNSTALGKSTASGFSSTALGFETFASGEVSTAMGKSTASGNYSTAMGIYSTASGFASTAMGRDATASGFASTAIGNYSNASGDYSTAMGASIASGLKSTAMGQSTASGAFSTALGYSNALGDYSTAMGSSTASGANSTAIGYYASTNNKTSSVCINGSSNTTSSTPCLNSQNYQMMMSFDTYTFWSGYNGQGVDLPFNGNSWVSHCDRNKKENFLPLNGESILKKISGIELTSWNYKKCDTQNDRHYGIMAQDFHAAFGHDAMGNIGNDSTVNPIDMIGIDMAAIQALEKRTQKLDHMQMNLEALRKENADIKKENQDIKKENQDIKKENAVISKENQDIKNENAEIKKENQDIKKELEEIKQLLKAK